MSLPPVVLFAFRRADMLARTLDGLRANGVSHIIAFSDGPRTPDDAAGVAEVRALLRGVDWATVELVERDRNLGLGMSLLDGVTAALARHDAVIVCEDDLVAVPGTVAWMAAALERYRTDARVASVSSWTHPRVTPSDIGERPFFSARVNTLFWGTWARAWRGMERGTAAERLAAYAGRGGDPAGYGADLPDMAAGERERNIWAVRWIAEHLATGSLSVCPPWTMVQHVGYDARATNAVHDPVWYQPMPERAAPVPSSWPEPIEHPAVAGLWRAAVAEEMRVGQPSLLGRAVRAIRRRLPGS